MFIDRPASRPTKYSRALVDKLCEIIERGTTITLACDMVGISHTTYNAWMNTNMQFSADIKKARAKGADNLIAGIQFAGTSGTWQAQAWILERSYGEHYGKQVTIQTNETKLDKLLDAFDTEVKRPDAE